MLTIEYIPYAEIANLDVDSKIRRLLKTVKENKIVLMQGRLKPSEEAELIQRTMEDVSRTFKGIELCTVIGNNKKKKDALERFRSVMTNFLVGNREGLTIIGPATVIKEIKKNPNKIELLTKELKERRRK